jgi:anthranilate/para-aminobenzoate synthase component I
LILSVGGGIVADSDPQLELEETRVKAEAFLRVL